MTSAVAAKKAKRAAVVVVEDVRVYLEADEIELSWVMAQMDGSSKDGGEHAFNSLGNCCGDELCHNIPTWTDTDTFFNGTRMTYKRRKPPGMRFFFGIRVTDSDESTRVLGDDALEEILGKEKAAKVIAKLLMNK